jgi:hypothetical protein
MTLLSDSHMTAVRRVVGSELTNTYLTTMCSTIFQLASIKRETWVKSMSLFLQFSQQTREELCIFLTDIV